MRRFSLIFPEVYYCSVTVSRVSTGCVWTTQPKDWTPMKSMNQHFILIHSIRDSLKVIWIDIHLKAEGRNGRNVVIIITKMRTLFEFLTLPTMGFACIFFLQFLRLRYVTLICLFTPPPHFYLTFPKANSVGKFDLFFLSFWIKIQTKAKRICLTWRLVVKI